MTRLFSKSRIVGIIVAFITISFGLNGWAADKKEIQKQIKSQVDEVVAGIDSGKKVQDFNSFAKKEPYFVFILEQSGKILLHPFYEGLNMRNISVPALEAVLKGTAEGLWVEYDAFGTKHAYVRKTKGGLFVGSGYKD
jgi:hypothetical protein